MAKLIENACVSLLTILCQLWYTVSAVERTHREREKMAKRTRYQIKMTFTAESRFDDSIIEGVLDGEVNSKSAIKRQVEASRAWLKAKGHKETGLTVEPITS